MTPNNPFSVVGYLGPEYFCDREKETRKILSWIENDSNVTLIAPRRYGKTGLIRNVLHYLPHDSVGTYIDIYSTRNLSEFVKQFVTAVVGVVDTPMEKVMATVARFFKSCRPTVVPQENGLPKFSFDISPSESEASLREAFDYLKHRERNLVIAIDEFQQILEYPETGTEALLRSFIQEVPWIRFVFAGSRQHLMSEMFASARHPFYNSTDILSLDVIACEKYAAFAEGFFRQAGKPFNRDSFVGLYEKFDGITWYVQRVLNRLWFMGDGVGSKTQVEDVIDELIEDRALTFRDLLDSQNEVARKLLPAIARAGIVAEPTSADFLATCALSASSVRSALVDLRARDLVYKNEKGYCVYDRLLGLWLKRITAR